MSTNNQTESTPKSSIWRGNDIAPEPQIKVVIMTIDSRLYFAKSNKNKDFVTYHGVPFTASIWKWTYLEELLALTEYEAITPDILKERIEQRDVEKAAEAKKVHRREKEVKTALQQFLSDITGGKAQVESVGIIKMRKD